ncbi:hypothetical protein Tco_0271147 [Tanacetum coccineum]
MPWLLRALTRAGDGGAYEPASKYGPSSIKGSGNSWSSALGEPISDKSSYGLEISNNMPAKRTSDAARAAAAALMTAVVVEQLIKARVSKALANHETL